MGNGQKAQHKRERLLKNAGKAKGSQLKQNEAAKTFMCTICRQTFLQTIRPKALAEHAENKHSKTLNDCFPGVEAA
ncbi:hypothetical protein H4R35_004234 [Dimargaris xerosporica]|nr:hypothetical protein H4R35_004234 [Dimargaris xerosporica]